MKPSLLLALALSIPAAWAAAAADTAQDDPAAWIKSAIERDWVASVNPNSGDVEVRSPIYPMRFSQGCVIHRLFFLPINGRPALDGMVAVDNYYAFAADQACATVDPAHFFEIHAGIANTQQSAMESSRLRGAARFHLRRLPAALPMVRLRQVRQGKVDCEGLRKSRGIGRRHALDNPARGIER